MLKSTLRHHMDVLELGRSASIADINSAFRDQSKALHPDAGGSPDDFAALQRSRDALIGAARSSRRGRIRAGRQGRDANGRPAPWLYGLAAAGVTTTVVGAAAVVLLDGSLIAVAVLSGVAVWLAVTSLLTVHRQHRRNVAPVNDYHLAKDVVRQRYEPSGELDRRSH